MNPMDLYRRAMRSGDTRFMSEAIVHLSMSDGNDELINSLNRRIELLAEGNEAAERMKIIMECSLCPDPQPTIQATTI